MKDVTLSGLWIAVVAVALAVSAVHAEEPLNLLFFGNSFTYVSDVEEQVRQMAVSDGHVSPMVLFDGAASKDLDYHIGQVASDPQNNVDHSSIKRKTWDYVIIQGYSTEATAKLGDGTFTADVLQLFHDVKNHSSGRGSGVVAIPYETWARPDLVPRKFASLEAMQAEIRNGYEAAAAAVISADGAGSARIGRVGDTFETLNFDSMLYGNDNYHQSKEGGIAAAMAIYRAIYKEDVSDIPFGAAGWSQISESDWNAIAAAADAQPIPDPGVAGDFDGDLDVDGADFMLWQRDPGVGNLPDWEANFGTSLLSVSSTSAVPEPATEVLLSGILFFMGVALFTRRRRCTF